MFLNPKWDQNGVRIASSTRKPSESLLEASWSALGGLQSRKKVIPEGSCLVQQEFQDRFQVPGEGGSAGGLLMPVESGGPFFLSRRKKQFIQIQHQRNNGQNIKFDVVPSHACARQRAVADLLYRGPGRGRGGVKHSVRTTHGALPIPSRPPTS